MEGEQEARRSIVDRVEAEERNIAADSSGALSTGRWAWEWAKSIIVAFGLFLVIRTFLVEAFRIPTGSMEESLLVGDFLLVNKAIYGSRIPFTNRRLPAFREPRRGDIVVFIPPHEADKNYVKRLVAVGGDTVAMRDKVLYLNGAPVHEPYSRYSDPNDTFAPRMAWQCKYSVDRGHRACMPMRDNWGPIVVPPGKFLTLGDNRDDSEDSRYWGFVDRDAIKGRPILIYFSFAARPDRPFAWLTSVRWDRIGDVVR